MEDKVDVPLKHIKHMKDINVHEVSKNPDEAAMVLEFALETITEQEKKIRHLQKHAYKLKTRVQSLTELTKHLTKHDNNLISDKALENMNVSIFYIHVQHVYISCICFILWRSSF